MSEFLVFHIQSRTLSDSGGFVLPYRSVPTYLE